MWLLRSGRCARLARPAVFAAGATYLAYRNAECDPAPSGKITPLVHAELEKLRPGEAQMRRKWEDDESGWHKLPPRAWPPVQPKGDELDELQKRVATEGTLRLRFDLATCLTFNLIDPAEGLRQYRELAAGGSIDAVVAIGTVLLEGIGRDQDDADVAEGVRLMRQASDAGHAQAHYELGTLHYLGSYPQHCADDEGSAYRCFARAAEQQHTSALFMQAEFLIGGNGVEADEAKAIPLLHAAAERGHRMARQYIRDYLDMDARQNAGTASVSPRAAAQRIAETLPTLPVDGSEHFCIFRGESGEKASFAELLAAAEECAVVHLGECHDDSVAHSLEAFVLISLAARREKVGLSLEMFERDTQVVLDEYLGGLIREADFVQDARPWANYASDYRPLVEFAKEVGLPVLAANAPRRYVGAVGRTPGVLRESGWSAEAYSWLPPLPLQAPSKAYLTHLYNDPAVVRGDQIGLDDEFSAANHGGGGGGEGGGQGGGEGGGEGGAPPPQGRCPYIGLRARDGLLEPMLLWDATMADAIVRRLAVDPDRLLVHVCGSFHCERHLGVVEWVEALRGAPVKQCVIAMYPEKDCHQWVPERHAGRADFVILTDATVQRSHDYMAA